MMTPARFFLLSFLFLSGLLPADAQRAPEVKIEPVEAVDRRLIQDVQAIFLKEKSGTANLPVFHNQLRKGLSLLHAAGYMEAVVSFSGSDSVGLIILYEAGQRYSWARIRTHPADEDILSSAGVNDRLYRRKIFTPEAYARLCNDILRYCTNNGYPFARVSLDSVQITGGAVDAYLNLDRGPLILTDTLLVRGNAKVTAAYLRNYLSLKPGEPFNEAMMRKIGVRLREIPFLTEARAAEIEFSPSSARPVLYLQSRKASQINGVIGVQPDNAGSGKVFVTGDLRLRLQNAFGKAELLDLNWSNPFPRSQDLKVKFSYPFLLSLPIGAEADLTLFKKDTTFLEINRQLGFRYFLAGNNSFRLFVGRKTSDLISTKGFENVLTLPPFADVSANTFGLGFQFQRLDYRLNPRKGYAVDLSAGAGVRTITRNPRINDVVYDSLDLRNTQYRGELEADLYLPVFRRGVVNLGVKAGWVESESIFTNELFRFGGLKTLRGFDELSLNASALALFKAEYRFILEQNSYLLLFYNQAWYEDVSRDVYFSDTPYGYGAGITFETKLGIFSFLYALGSQQGNPVEFRSAKVHFGLINYF